jgi:hypothetical protein
VRHFDSDDLIMSKSSPQASEFDKETDRFDQETLNRKEVPEVPFRIHLPISQDQK